MEIRSQHRLIAIVVPPQAQLLDVAGPMDAFLEAKRQSAGRADYELRVIAVTADKMVHLGGMSLVAHSSIFDGDHALDTLLVAGSTDPEQANEHPMLRDWLRRQTALARRYGSIGDGAFFLGAAGLLDGMTATTHCQRAADLAQRYPAAKIIANQIYVEDGTLYTSAGVTAGVDLALKLIEDDFGRDLARKVARRLVVSLSGAGRQGQSGAHLAEPSADEDRIRAVQCWIMDHPSLDLTLQALAGRAAMGVRHFTRVFRRETGTTPGSFVETVRIEAATRLLAESDLPLNDVAKRCGFANSEIMRQAFLRRTGARPSHYRRRTGSGGCAGHGQIVQAGTSLALGGMAGAAE